jgi:hypothetical protein
VEEWEQGQSLVEQKQAQKKQHLENRQKQECGGEIEMNEAAVRGKGRL